MFIRQFKNEANKQKGGSFEMLLSIVWATILENILFVKSAISDALCDGGPTASDWVIQAKEWTIRPGENSWRHLLLYLVLKFNGFIKANVNLKTSENNFMF